MSEIISKSDEFSKVLLQNFTNEEQRLFVQSFQAYLHYGNDDSAFVIDLEDVWQWLGFARIDNCKNVLFKNFKIGIHYIEKCLLRQITEQKTSNRGGHNKVQVLMTVKTFKKLCMKASTKRAEEVCDYYVKMEDIMHQYIHHQLQEKNQSIMELQNKAIEHSKNMELERHKALIDAHDMQKLVYIMKVEEFANGTFVIKIGESSDIKDRVEKLKSLFKTQVIVLHLFPCARNYELEQALHKTKGIVEHKYVNPINNTVKSTETFLIDSIQHYKKVVKIVKNMLYTYKNDNTENNKWHTINRIIDICHGDTEKIKEMLTMINETVNNDNHQVQNSDDETDKDDNSNTPSNTYHTQIVSNKAFGPKVQLYDGNDTKKLIRVFDSITIATREVNDASFTQIKFASKNKKMYLGYRWHLISRNDPNPNEPRDIGETVETKLRKTGLVACISLDKSRILNVFSNQKQASLDIQQHPSAMCSAIKYGSLLNGCYWMLWDDVPTPLQSSFCEVKELPNEVKSKPRGVIVQKINATTNEIVTQYASISDACKICKASPSSIKGAVLKNTPFQGYLWKLVHSFS
jgi:hypothetical protein